MQDPSDEETRGPANNSNIKQRYNVVTPDVMSKIIHPDHERELTQKQREIMEMEEKRITERNRVMFVTGCCLVTIIASCFFLSGRFGGIFGSLRKFLPFSSFISSPAV